MIWYITSLYYIISYQYITVLHYVTLHYDIMRARARGPPRHGRLGGDAEALRRGPSVKR